MDESQGRDLSEFFKLARDMCCNYSVTGPFKRRHYCCLEPRESELQCLLSKNLGFRWFVEAVLPLDEDLEAEWERMWMVSSDPSPLPGIYRTCQCGKRFKAKSNRQRMCTECSKTNRKKLSRNAVRRHRKKGVVL